MESIIIIILSLNAHDSEINTLSWSPFNEYYLISGSSDKTVGLWDSRNLSRKLHKFEGHSEEVYCVNWSPFSEAIIASSGNDRRIHIWDLCIFYKYIISKNR